MKVKNVTKHCTDAVNAAKAAGCEDIQIYDFGTCSVMISKDAGRWHLSISHPSRLPIWTEIREARYRFIPNEVYMAMILPPKEDYVNVHPHCMHLFEIDGEKRYSDF